MRPRMSDLARYRGDDHECPGCGRAIPDFMFTCSRCWEKLPVPVASDVIISHPNSNPKMVARIKRFFDRL